MLHLGDCLDVMRTLPAGSVDALKQRDATLQSALTALRRSYEMDAGAEDFICGNIDLLPVLVASEKAIRQYFGEGARLTLRLDPDERDGLSELFIKIDTPLPVREATDRLLQLDDEWFLDVAADCQDKLNIILGR